MAVAVRALDFDALAVGIGQTLHSARDFVVERWPTTMRVELIFGAVELRVAATAEVGASLVKVIVLTGEGRFGALGLDDGRFCQNSGSVLSVASSI